ncbi:MAG: asparagine synthase-related protein [Candidatus Thorarchaeota archaeon]|nr:asparagine synthase-related protein [Candidatus Thorarchaeota archaeon]
MSDLAVRPEVQRDANPEQVLKSLKLHLERSFARLSGRGRCAVLFSGGVDSALAALMTSRQCEDTLLITARCEGSHDVKVAVKAAEAMSLKHVEIPIDSESIWNILPQVMHSIKSRRRMNVEIAIPFFFAAQEARSQGYNLIVSGQGPDELFAGYARYEKLLIEHGPQTVEDMLWRDVSTTDEVNIQRDAGAIGAHGLESFFPFLDQEFARTALSIPVTMNIDPSKRPSRKLLFRELALKLGVPEDVALTPKRATQYSSGTAKMLAESFRFHVEDMRELSKKELQQAIQGFLDEMKL